MPRITPEQDFIINALVEAITTGVCDAVPVMWEGQETALLCIEGVDPVEGKVYTPLAMIITSDLEFTYIPPSEVGNKRQH